MKQQWWLTEVRTKKEWWLAAGVALATLVAALVLIRWFAPQLLGLPVDLQSVRISRAVAPFYESVFRVDNWAGNKFLLNDPLTRIRARPFLQDLTGLGPHDLLGFRNRAVPNVADVIAIGDSQTYGNNVAIEDTWPYMLASRVSSGNMPVVYSMATGGWGGVQYLNMLHYSLVFRPRVIVVAFYTGNDAYDSASMVYSSDNWKSLRPVPKLDLSDAPPNPGMPVPRDELWIARFRDRSAMAFTPSLRLVSNDATFSVVRVGYQTMESIAREMDRVAGLAKVKLVFIIFPTKEMVYVEKVRSDRLSESPAYTKLITHEREHIARLSSFLSRLPNSTYVDIVKPLQREVMKGTSLYPSNPDGHPLASGYRLVSEKLAPHIRPHLSSPVSGYATLRAAPGRLNHHLLLSPRGYRIFSSEKLVQKNGWQLNDARVISPREIANTPYLGVITTVNPAIYGPQAAR